MIHRNADDYYLENLSAHGTWVNDTKVSGRVKLRATDTIKLSDEALVRFEPAGMPQGLLARRNLLIMAILLLLLIAGSLAIFNPFAPPPVKSHIDKTYDILSGWLDDNVKDQSQPMPSEAQRLFNTGWRLYKAEDYADSRDVWLKLQILLEAQDSKYQFREFSAEYPKALDKLNTAPEGSNDLKPDDDEARAAFVEFVQRCLDFTAKKTQSSEVGP